ncbi:actin-binding Rho-activating protein-like [Uloborus diversus]|uniref:actin-binding Rho-activating protein-like n=1 Tax=Uloborus diversus TaxID=327109 RepID=UPI00240A4659|nr:actin-binding Rho-activating protein-like [Uloborus diversus]
MESESKKPIKIYGNDALSSRVAAFQKKAEEHKVKQKTNPFSHSGNVSHFDRPKWDKNDPRYGRPAEGSKTEQRGMAAGAHISNEVLFLCEMINEYGVPCENDTVCITFGELFQIYTTISNKVVGLLMRARKHGLLHFEGEMLFQRRDDDVIITLLKPLSELKQEFGPKAPPKRKHEVQEEVLPISPEDY